MSAMMKVWRALLKLFLGACLVVDVVKALSWKFIKKLIFIKSVCSNQ